MDWAALIYILGLTEEKYTVVSIQCQHYYNQSVTVTYGLNFLLYKSIENMEQSTIWNELEIFVSLGYKAKGVTDYHILLS